MTSNDESYAFYTARIPTARVAMCTPGRVLRGRRRDVWGLLEDV